MMMMKVGCKAEAATFSFDVQRRPNESKQRSIEHHRSVTVEWHIHRHQTLCKTS